MGGKLQLDQKMTITPPLPPEITERFAKLSMKYRNPASPAERESAREQAFQLAKPYGFARGDVNLSLAHGDRLPPTIWENPYIEPDDFRWLNPGSDPFQRRLLLLEYGSVDNVLIWNKQEMLLRAAVREWSVFYEPPNDEWTESIDGLSGLALCKVPPQHILQAIANAYPLPTTITMAAEEVHFWERRDRELGLALCDTTDTQLDAAPYLRFQLVSRLLEADLPAESISEILLRQKQHLKGDNEEKERGRVILRDLERLSAR